MSPEEREWLSSYNPDTFALCKAQGKKLGVPMGVLMSIGLVGNKGPSEPQLWDLYITPLGRYALGEIPLPEAV